MKPSYKVKTKRTESDGDLYQVSFEVVPKIFAGNNKVNQMPEPGLRFGHPGLLLVG